VPNQKTGRIDVVARTQSQKVAFELYHTGPPPVLNVIQKIKQRREKMPSIAKWAAVIHQNHATKYAMHREDENIKTVAWYQSGSKVEFFVITRYRAEPDRLA